VATGVRPPPLMRNVRRLNVLLSRANVIAEPVRETGPVHAAGGKIEDDALLVVNRRLNLEVVEDQERFHRRMADAFVAVKEWVVPHDREAERGGLLDDRDVQVLAAKRRAGCAAADSRAPRFRMPARPPLASRTDRWRNTISPSVR